MRPDLSEDTSDEPTATQGGPAHRCLSNVTANRRPQKAPEHTGRRTVRHNRIRSARRAKTPAERSRERPGGRSPGGNGQAL